MRIETLATAVIFLVLVTGCGQAPSTGERVETGRGQQGAVTQIAADLPNKFVLTVSPDAYDYPTTVGCFEKLCLNLPVFTDRETKGALGTQAGVTYKMSNVLREMGKALAQNRVAPSDFLAELQFLAESAEAVGDTHQQWYRLMQANENCYVHHQAVSYCAGEQGGQVIEELRKEQQEALERFAKARDSLYAKIDRQADWVKAYPEAPSVIAYECEAIQKLARQMEAAIAKNTGLIAGEQLIIPPNLFEGVEQQIPEKMYSRTTGGMM